MEIGNIKLDNNKIIAPMAGVTDLAYRLICKEMGAGLTVSEMISAKGLYYKDKKTKSLIDTNEEEKPYSVQIFGSDEDILASVIENNLNEDERIDIIDFNLGCPAPKIVKNGEGSALLKDLNKLESILKAMVKASKKPVTLKTRLGWDWDNIVITEVGKIAENAGISAITVHARTRSDFYSGHAKWEYIKKLKENINMPIIANGDIFTKKDLQNISELTDAHGYALGRGVMGNPWLIKEAISFLNGKEYTGPNVDEKIDMAIKHLKLTIKLKGERIGVREMRSHIGWYLKGLDNAKKYRDKIKRLEKLEEIEKTLMEYKENHHVDTLQGL